MSINEIEHLMAMFIFFQVLNIIVCLFSKYIMGILAIFLYCDVMGIPNDYKEK
jgi:hypothetical protein